MLDQEIFAATKTTFLKPILKNFADNIAKSVCDTVANMLAIDYLTRLDSKLAINPYASSCVDKLGKFLEQKVIVEDDFSTAMTLFAAAIASDYSKHDNKNEVLEEQFLPVSQAIIGLHLGNIASNKQKEICESLYSMPRETSSKILAYIHKDPEFCKSLLISAKEDQNQILLLNLQTKAKLSNILGKAKKLDDKSYTIEQSTSKITTAACIISIILLSTTISGPASLLTIPAVALTASIVPVIGEQIGQAFFNSMSSTKSTNSRLNQLKSEILAEVALNTEQVLAPVADIKIIKAIKQKLSDNISLDKKDESQEFDSIKTSLAKHLIIEVKNTSKSEQVKQERQKINSTDNTDMYKK